jgi:hypothetical protein
MAFNPLSSFRKYPKIWMAGVLLVCMLTFVFERLFTGNYSVTVVLVAAGVVGFVGLSLIGYALTEQPVSREFLAMGGGVLVLAVVLVAMGLISKTKEQKFVEIGGRNYTYVEFEEYKDRRNIANEFMRTLCDVAIRQLEKELKSATPGDLKDDKKKQRLAVVAECQRDLFTKVTQEQRYFHGGSKLSDLIDFIVWLKLADKYDVQLSDDDVRKLVDREVHAFLWGFDPMWSRHVQDRVRQTTGARNFDDDMLLKALRDEFRARIIQIGLMGKISGGPLIPTPNGMGPERDFFATFNLYLHTPMHLRVSLTPEQLFSYYTKTRTELDFDLLPVKLDHLAEKVSLPDDPAKRTQILKAFYDKYAEKPYDPSEGKPGFLFPAQAQIQFLTADAGQGYYKGPVQVISKLQKATAFAFNPSMPFAGALTNLAQGPAWETSLQRNYDALQANYQKQWDNYITALKFAQAQGKLKEIDTLLKAGPPAFKYAASSYLTPSYYSPTQHTKALEKPQATSAAATAAIALGALTRTDAPWATLVTAQANAYAQQAETLKPMVEAEVHKQLQAEGWLIQALGKEPPQGRPVPGRAQVGGELIMARLQTLLPGPGAFTSAGLTYYAGNKSNYLPLAGFVEDDLRTAIEDKLAQEWMNADMLAIKAELDSVKNRKPDVFKERLESILQRYSRPEVHLSDVAAAGLAAPSAMPRKISGVKLGGTTKLRNEFDIDLDDNLKLLRDGFDKARFLINSTEGRAGKPEMLKEGDFFKLFFSNEPLGVGPLSVFQPNVWPPYITPKKTVETLVSGAKAPPLRLFDTDPQPIIYWKSTQDLKKVLPWNPQDADFMKLVEKQYRMNEARNLIMGEVKKLTDELKKEQQKEGFDMRAKLRDLAKEHGVEIVPLTKVALLVPAPFKSGSQEEIAAYDTYTLPRGRIPFARDDTVKHLLSLNNQSAPVKVGVKEVDDLNEALFLTLKDEKVKKVVKQIQVLTNKPRSDYYIVTLASVKEPSSFHFFDEILPKSFAMGKEHNRFVDQAQAEFSKEFLAALTKQLRMDFDVAISENASQQIEKDATSGQH